MGRKAKQGYQMTPEHKEQLAVGREQARVVKEYLEALSTYAPKRGRKRTPESIEKRLLAIEEQLELTNDKLAKLQLISEREQLEAEHERITTENRLPELESAFIEVAFDYATRKNVSYSAFRSLGVPPAVLRAAGLSRTAA